MICTRTLSHFALQRFSLIKREESTNYGNNVNFYMPESTQRRPSWRESFLLILATDSGDSANRDMWMRIVPLEDPDAFPREFSMRKGMRMLPLNGSFTMNVNISMFPRVNYSSPIIIKMRKLREHCESSTSVN